MSQCFRASAVAMVLLTLGVLASPAAAETEIADILAASDTGSCDELCDDNWCPLWTVQAGAVILNRSRPAISPIVAQFALFTGEELNFGWTAGPDVSVARRLANGDSLELRYFGALNWDADAASTVAPFLLTVDYVSRLNSTELNWRRPAGDCFTWLAGFRAIQLHEVLDFAQIVPPVSIGSQFNVDNHLYGGQIGGQVDLCPCCGPLSLRGVMKAGVYGNFADYDFVNTFNSQSITLPVGDKWHTAFVGEIGITAAYPLTDHLSVRGGYQLLWIDGVALASDQDFPFPATTIDTSSHVFYHGALVGLEMAW